MTTARRRTPAPPPAEGASSAVPVDLFVHAALALVALIFIGILAIIGDRPIPDVFVGVASFFSGTTARAGMQAVAERRNR